MSLTRGPHYKKRGLFNLSHNRLFLRLRNHKKEKVYFERKKKKQLLFMKTAASLFDASN